MEESRFRNSPDAHSLMKDIKCEQCGKLFSKYGIKNHIAIVHEGDFKRVSHKGNTKGAWNKGLTKETNQIVKESSFKLKEKFKTNELISHRKGFIHSKESKENLSLYRINYLKNNPEKVPYRLNHSSKESYPEKLFKESLEKNNIKGWIQEFNNSIYQYDFAFLELKIDIEIDGGTHLLEKVKQIDKRRDEWSNSQGWIVIRFTAKEIKENIDKCINIIKELLVHSSIGRVRPS